MHTYSYYSLLPLKNGLLSIVSKCSCFFHFFSHFTTTAIIKNNNNRYIIDWCKENIGLYRLSVCRDLHTHTFIWPIFFCISLFSSFSKIQNGKKWKKISDCYNNSRLTDVIDRYKFATKQEKSRISVRFVENIRKLVHSHDDHHFYLDIWRSYQYIKWSTVQANMTGQLIIWYKHKHYYLSLFISVAKRNEKKNSSSLKNDYQLYQW